MDAATLAAFSAVWGPPAPGTVQTASSDQLLDLAWSERPSWAIIPFETLNPRWKVLSVDGQSPIEKNFVRLPTFIRDHLGVSFIDLFPIILY